MAAKTTRKKSEQFSKTEEPEEPVEVERWEPWTGFGELWNDFRRDLVDPVRGSLSRFRMFGDELWRVPRIDIRDTGDEYELKAELPGIPKENVEVGLTDNRIEIRAQERKEVEEERKGYFVRESGRRAFYRSMTLPSDADKESLEASMNDGILRVTIGKATPASSSRQRIPIR